MTVLRLFQPHSGDMDVDGYKGQIAKLQRELGLKFSDLANLWEMSEGAARNVVYKSGRMTTVENMLKLVQLAATHGITIDLDYFFTSTAEPRQYRADVLKRMGVDPRPGLNINLSFLENLVQALANAAARPTIASRESALAVARHLSGLEPNTQLMELYRLAIHTLSANPQSQDAVAEPRTEYTV